MNAGNRRFRDNQPFGTKLGNLLTEAGFVAENMKSDIPEFTVESFVDYIDEMINDDDERYAWSLETLEGIRSTVVSTNRITERQIESVTNIRFSVRNPL